MAELTRLDVPTHIKQPVIVEIDTTNASGDGPLSAEACNTNGDSSEVKIQEDDPKKYTITFDPPSPDKYDLTIKWGEEMIVGSPLKLNLGPSNREGVTLSDPPSGTLKSKENIKIGFDTFEAGCGEFTSTCRADGVGDVPVSVTRRGFSFNYDIEFTPPHEDVYFVSVKWSGKDIKGSPYKLDMIPVKPSKVIISNLTVPEEAGGLIELDVCTEGAGNAKLQAICKGSEVGTVPVAISTVSPSNFHLSAQTASQPDTYVLSVKYSGQNVPGSPLYANLLPTDANKVEVQEPQSAELGQDACYVVNTTRAGKGKLAATCQGENCGEIEVEIKEEAGKYFVTFRPDEADVYTIAIQWDGSEVPNSPFKLDLIPLGHDRVKHLSTTIPDTRDAPVVLSFDTFKAGPGELRARVAGASSGPVSSTAVPIPGSDHENQVSFVPVNADTYFVDVYWNDEAVPGSPFNIAIIHPEKIVFGTPNFVELEIPVELNADTTEAGPGTFSASCEGEKSGKMEVFVEDNLAESENKYIISFRPSNYDVYSLSVYFAEAEVSESPFVVDIKEPEIPVINIIEPAVAIVEPVVEVPQPEQPDASKCFIFGLDSMQTNLTPGVKVAFGVNAAAAGEGQLSVSVNGPSSSSEEPQIVVQSSEEDPHVYNIEYTPTACGTHQIHLQWASESIPGSPVVLSIGEVKEIPTFPMNKPYVIQFVADCDSSEVRSYGIHEDTGNHYDLTVGKGRRGKAKLTFRAKLPGVYALHILIANEELPGSPYQVKFIESDAQACRVVDLPDRAYLGEESSFKIDARKAGLGDLHVRAQVPTGGKGTQFGHEDHNNGYYSIFFTPLVPGVHHFDISWAGTTIIDSPVELVADRRDPDLQTTRDAASKVHILKEDLYIFTMVLPSSLPAYFCINTASAGKGKLTLKASGPSEAKVSILDRKNGIYTAEVQPVVSGKYHISILWNDIHIQGSPCVLNFTGDKSHVINGLDFENVSFLIDVPYKFHIHRDEKEEGDLEITCNPTTAASISCEPLDHAPSSYLCEIVPKEVGNHEISIKYNDKNVFNSPHNVQFEPNPENDAHDSIFSPLDVTIDMYAPHDDTNELQLAPSHPVANNVKVFGPGLVNGPVGQEGNFTIETSKAGEGKLEIDVGGPKGAFKINMRRHPENDRTILVRYDPVVTGKYTIDVLWSEERVPGSPFSVDIGEQTPDKATIEI